MRILFYILIPIILSTASVHAHARSGHTDETQYHEYYSIEEDGSSSEFFRSSVENLFPLDFLTAAKEAAISLLKWSLHYKDLPTPSEPYQRKAHFGRWINDPTDDSCMNTRAKVLVRDSHDDVTFRNERECVVDSGRWIDPYSRQEFTSSREIQVDHMVPLKHAYMAGAWKWNYKTRCLFANYMGYKKHLIPASVHENTSKGDRAPQDYLPSNESYRCQYVKNWLTIKLIWRLAMTEDEAQAITDVITTYECNPESFRISEKDLDAQRKYISQNLNFCTQNQR